MLNFGFVAPPYDDRVWVAAFGLLDKTVQRGGLDWIWVSECLADGRAQLWLTTQDGRPITASVSRMDGDTFEVWLAGGAVLSGSIPFLETAIKAAKEAGAKRGKITGRKGWARVLQQHGWRQHGEDLVKDF
jgi:hypothetical protein